jgi:nucleoside-diphosphate-sugar epimerase
MRSSEIHCDWVIVRPTSIWGPWFEHSYKKFFQVLNHGWYVQPGAEPITKPLGYVGNTVHMMNKILYGEEKSINHNTYYLGDYPQHSIQEWADLIRTELGRPGKTPVFPIAGLRLMAKIGDTLKLLGWNDPPLTSFRLNNMLTGAHYPIEKTQEVVGELPFTLKEGVQQTLEWMAQEGLIQK